MRSAIPVSSGELRHRISIDVAVETPDGAGGVVQTWQAVADVWAAIRPRQAREVFAEDRVTGRITHDIWLRYRDGVLPGMRFRLGQRVFDVRGVVSVDEAREWLLCPAEEQDL